jgi:hypothetical protein
MPFYRKKPVIIEAMQWDGSIETADKIEVWSGGKTACRGTGWNDQDTILAIFVDTLEGQMKAFDGDWIIKGIVGEFYPCKAEIFAATYEPADDDGDLSTSARTSLPSAVRCEVTPP